MNFLSLRKISGQFLPLSSLLPALLITLPANAATSNDETNYDYRGNNIYPQKAGDVEEESDILTVPTPDKMAGAADLRPVSFITQPASASYSSATVPPPSSPQLAALDYTLPDLRLAFAPENPQADLNPGIGPQDVHYAATGQGQSTADPNRFRNFGQQAGAVKWEMAAILAYYTAINGSKLTRDPQWPGFHKEGWFGKSTHNLGVDKLAHSYSSYILAEILHARLRRKTGDAPGIQFTAAALASATMLYTELWDSIEPTSGWSWEDVTFNTLGAGFSILRNSVPGLDEKLDFRLMIVPNSNIINTQGKRHFEQQHHFFALKFAGFEGLKKGPLRYLEFHLGYRAKDFTLEDRRLGVEPKRHIFVGFGLNLRELFFKNSRSRIGRAAGEVMDYFQPPYTAVHHNITN